MRKTWTRWTLLTLIAAPFLSAPAAAVIPPDDHYLCDFPSRLEVYRDYRWYPYELPIQVYIPPVPAGTPNPQLYPEVVRAAFASWNRYVPQFRFVFINAPAGAQMRIKWIEHFPESESTWGMAMFPHPRRGSDGKLRHFSEITLALKTQEGTGMGTGNIFFSRDELLGITTHEVGHALGLPHSRNPDDLMYPAIFRFVASSSWGISQRDLATLKYLYGLPAKLEIPPCNGH